MLFQHKLFLCQGLLYHTNEDEFLENCDAWWLRRSDPGKRNNWDAEENTFYYSCLPNIGILVLVKR